MTMIDFEPLTIVVPLREEPSGVLRVGNSRVLLELVLRAFKAGATSEAIVQSYDTLNLADVYAVVSRYLVAPGPFEEYLRIREEAAAEARRKIEQLQGPQDALRAILLARAKSQGGCGCSSWSAMKTSMATSCEPCIVDAQISTSCVYRQVLSVIRSPSRPGCFCPLLWQGLLTLRCLRIGRAARRRYPHPHARTRGHRLSNDGRLSEDRRARAARFYLRCARHTVMFFEQGDKVTLTLQASVVKSTAEAAPYLARMEAGWTQSLERLEAYVAQA